MTDLAPPVPAPSSTGGIVLGPQITGDLDEAARREWLVTDGRGGYAMGTAAFMRTRRYHGLLVVSDQRGAGRHLALASLDPVLLIGDRRVRLATDEWTDGVVDPTGHRLLSTFALVESVPRWRWSTGGIVVECELAMARGRPATGVVYRILRAPTPVALEVTALCTWRDAHGTRRAADGPDVAYDESGFTFDGCYRVEGPGCTPTGAWYRGVHLPAELARGLDGDEDVCAAGTFRAELAAGDALPIVAWAGDLADRPASAISLIGAARSRAGSLAGAAGAQDDVDRLLAQAADRFIVAGPDVIAGYPWFGHWSRDALISYEGLFLATGRDEEGREVLRALGGRISEGMLPNTDDTEILEYNAVDAPLWFAHAVHTHAAITNDITVAAELVGHLEDIVDHYRRGTRFGIHVDPDDGLVTQGADGVALTWMDARVGHEVVTPRAGKPVEINALWISTLARLARLQNHLRRDASLATTAWELAHRSFARRFRNGGALFDVIDGPSGNDPALRPNQLFAVSLPDAPLSDPSVVHACRDLVTPLGLRTLSPDDPAYRGRHEGPDADARDRAYHQGTVWPWLIGPYVEAALRTGVALDGVLDGLDAHVREWGLGSVSECANGDAPHEGTGCPFQAWSVAELLRARRMLRHGFAT